MIKTVLYVQAKIELMQKSMRNIKEEIQQLTAANTFIAERIKQEDYEVETDYECDSETDLSLPQAEAKLSNKNCLQKKVQDLKFDKY